MFYCQIISCSYVCAIVVLGYQHPRIMFNCIFKWTSNAIMMRDGGNTLHSCLIDSCCTFKVDDIILVFCLVLFPIFFLSFNFYLQNILSVFIYLKFFAYSISNYPCNIIPKTNKWNIVSLIFWYLQIHE